MTAYPDPKPRQRRISGDQRAILARDADARYNAGDSVRTIAEALDISYGLTHRLLTEAGTTFRRRGGRGPGRRN